MLLDSTTLFAANAAVLAILALAFVFAGRRSDEPYWRSWAIANVVVALSLLTFMFRPAMPSLVATVLPSVLLLLGFGFRWRAAREFGGRAAVRWVVWGPAAFFLVFGAIVTLLALPAVGAVSVSLIAGALALAIAYEFWRDRADGLASRWGLVASYCVVAATFLLRAGAGASLGDGFPGYLSVDVLRFIQLTLSLVHIPAVSVFALTLAYERSAAELRRVASHDALTGLLNRGAFEQAARAMSGMVAPCAAIVIDLDHFKQVNDSYGHASGDAALIRCAALCLDAAPAGAVVGRIGGEEFAVFLSDVSEEETRLVAERVRRAVQAEILTCGDRVFRVTASIGCAWRDRVDDGYEAMMREADAALYRAKDGGRNRVERGAA